MKFGSFAVRLAAALVTCAVFVPASLAATDPALQTAPSDGWASQSGGTVGGSAAVAGHIYTVTNRAELLNSITNGGGQPKIIKIVGVIDMSEGTPFSGQADQTARGVVRIPSNTTLVGNGAGAGISNGSLLISGASQVIIRNIKIVNPCDVAPVWSPTDGPTGAWNSRYDGITIETSDHVWIDHNTFTDSPVTDDTLIFENGVIKQCHDGGLDISSASDFITVSYNVFSLHDKNNLVGSSDTAIDDEGHLRITFSNNVFTNVMSRAPRVRFGQVHVFNNYFAGSKTHPAYPHIYSIGAGISAKILSHNNVFEITGATSCDDIIRNPNSASPAGAFKDGGSTLNGAAVVGCTLSNAVSWAVPYSFTPRPNALVKANALAQSGAGKLSTTISGTGNSSSVNSSSSSSSSSSESETCARTPTSYASNCWTETFAAADKKTFFSASYAAQPNGLPLYTVLGGSSNMILSGGVLKLYNGRFSVGQAETGTSTSSYAPAGIFDFSRGCTLIITAAYDQAFSGTFQVFVDNTTTSASNSPLYYYFWPSPSIVVDTHSYNYPLVAGDNYFTIYASSSGSDFLQFRADSASASIVDGVLVPGVFIKGIRLNCARRY